MDFYLDASILQQPIFTGCQVYTYQILNSLLDVGADDRFHLHFAMPGWNDKIDTLTVGRQNAVVHRHSGRVGRHLASTANVLRTRSRAYYIMNGLTGQLRVPVPCRTGALIHDLRNTLFPQVFGEAERVAFNTAAQKWMHARDLIFTGAETVKQEIIDNFGVAPEKIVVAAESTDHLDVNAPESRPAALPEGAPYLLMVNLGCKLKNWDGVLNAFSIYLRENPDDTDTLLVLAGSLRNQKDAILERIGSDPLLAARTLNLGYLSDAELMYVYRHARMLVFPSRYEGFGIPVLEAMGQGVPVLLSDIPIFHEVAGDAAVFVPLEKPEELAEGMRRLNFETDLRDTLVRKGRERVTHFSWKKSAAVTLDALRGLGS